MAKHDAAPAEEAALTEDESVRNEHTTSSTPERTKQRGRPWWEALASVTKAIIGTFGL